MHPPIHFTGGVTRRSTITVRHKIDCKTGQEIVPSTFEEAIGLLDFSLPLDYKAAIVSESLHAGFKTDTAYRRSDYGASVNDDLFDYFYDAWSLGKKNNICQKRFGDKYAKKEMGCYSLLIDRLIEIYEEGMIETEFTREEK
jgi:hypothetical protein